MRVKGCCYCSVGVKAEVKTTKVECICSTHSNFLINLCFESGGRMTRQAERQVGGVVDRSMPNPAHQHKVLGTNESVRDFC